MRLDHLLLADAVLSGVMFLGFLYALGKQFARGAPAALIGCVVTVLFTSPEGPYALLELWWQDRPLSLVPGPLPQHRCREPLDAWRAADRS